MQQSDGIVTTQREGHRVDEYTSTSLEEEKQNNEINRSNANLVFTPEFIPYYVSEKKEYGLTHAETVLYGFVRFYTKNASSRFYFTNEQLSEICDCSIPSITRGVKKLQSLGIIAVSRKVRAGGGQIRFIKADSSKGLVHNSSKGLVATNQNVGTNKNKINDNIKIDNKKREFDIFWKLYPKKIARSIAEQKFNKLPFKKIPIAMAGLAKYIEKRKVEETDTRYIPNPATWINQERREDEITIDRPKQKPPTRSIEEIRREKGI